MHPLHHAESSVAKWGGEPDDYLAIHEWFDQSKSYVADFRHRAMRHHSEGIFMAERLFGLQIVNSDGRSVPVRFIGEQHVLEDLGRIPSVQDWLENIAPQAWMFGVRSGPGSQSTTGDSVNSRNRDGAVGPGGRAPEAGCRTSTQGDHGA